MTMEYPENNFLAKACTFLLRVKLGGAQRLQSLFYIENIDVLTAFTIWLTILGRPILECFQRPQRSEEHTSELQSRLHLVCRLLLEKKKHSRTDPLVSRD